MKSRIIMNNALKNTNNTKKRLKIGFICGTILLYFLFGALVVNIVKDASDLKTMESIKSEIGMLDETNFNSSKPNTLEELSALIESQKTTVNLSIILGVLFLSSTTVLIIMAKLMKNFLTTPLSDSHKSQKSGNNPNGSIFAVIDEYNEDFSKLNRIINLISNINKDISFEGILSHIYVSFKEFIPYTHIGIALLKNDGHTLEASYGISSPEMPNLANKLVGVSANIFDTSLYEIIKNNKARIINDLDTYLDERPNAKNKLYNKIILECGIKSSITLPLNVNNKPVGIIFFSSTKKNAYTESHTQFLETIAEAIAISLNKNIFIDELLLGTIYGLAKMAEKRDEDTGEHLERMKKYCVAIAKLLQEDKVYDIDYLFIKELERFAPMHDIGKVGIRDKILLKPGKLTDEEFSEMKMHTIYGATVLKTVENSVNKHKKGLFKFGIDIALCHHEKWDGSGYPKGLVGEDIPLSARIVAVADVLDALTSHRVYKKAMDFESAFDIIMEGRGSHFDPKIVDTILRHKNEIHSLYLKLHQPCISKKEA